jgi:hypothetical protein
MASALTLRVRGPNGQSTLTLSADVTVAALAEAVAERTGVQLARLELRSGFPLRLLDWRSAPGELAKSIGLSSGESLQASETAAEPVAEPSPAAAPASADVVLLADDSGFAVQRRLMASDNSCLFRAVAYIVRSTVSSLPSYSAYVSLSSSPKIGAAARRCAAWLQMPCLPTRSASARRFLENHHRNTPPGSCSRILGAER